MKSEGLSMNKEPKRYLCKNCGFISSRWKALKLPGITFAVCFKCRGSLLERKEWTEWLYARRNEHIEQAKKYHEGYVLGVKVT
jgi:Zn-finger nucleic acid-binding protein